ncbi:methyltransferase domain-containing protein [Glycocaulis profundi]|nr:methyltransferase domain-containing protein [Glycocaulis profundi]
MTSDYRAAAKVAEDYYDSPDADAFYAAIWGGEDIHVGIYAAADEPIREASARTVTEMAARLEGLKPGARVLDMGAGYGGAARHLAREHGAHVTCLNLSDAENARNRALTAEQGLEDRIEVIHGSFEDMPFDPDSFDIVWSQDAILHSGDRPRVLAEAVRVMKPGAALIFTDPMQADAIDDPAPLQPIYERIHLPDLGSVAFYRDRLKQLGLEEVKVERLTHQLRTHYDRVRQELAANRDSLKGKVSDAYVERMLKGLGHWVEGADAGHLAWGILHFRKG